MWISRLKTRRAARWVRNVRFLIAPNAGEEKKPLSKIASGGELSRVMLSLKALSAERAAIPSMVFDEIDTGISGRTAQVVAQKMWDIARYRQVICVTHLQQIGRHGDAPLSDSEGRKQRPHQYKCDGAYRRGARAGARADAQRRE